MNRASRPSVLVVAYDFPPHAAIGTMRTLRVVRRLHAAGWNVTVLTSDPARFLESTPRDTALLGQVPDDVKVLRAGTLRLWDASTAALKSALSAARGNGAATRASASTPRPFGRPTPPIGGVGRVKDVIDAAFSIPDREAGWLLPALSLGVRHRLRAHAPDVIYSSSPPWTGQLVAAGLKAMLRRPWVADFRDPWSRAPWRGDRFRFAIGAAGVLERFVVKRADRIIFVAAGNRSDFAAHYGPGIASKFHLVPNGCDPAEFDALDVGTTPTAAPHVMLHAGSLYAGRTPVPVFKAIALALQAGRLDRRAFRLRFLGSNAMSTDLPNACRQLGIDDVVEFLPRVPRQDGLRAMVSATSLLLLQPGHTVSVPGKVYEYLAAGRPIFALAEEGETAEVVRQSGIGVSVTPEDESSIVEGLLEVVRMSQSVLSRPPRELYDGNLGAETIEGLLREAVAR
jgi:glycosyltransferase involved in cell wall biosynthesis